MGMVKHSQSSQNSKFAMSLQYLQKEVRDEVDFLHADKDESLLQIGTMIFDQDGASPKVSKIASLQFPYNTTKEAREEDFLHAGKH